MTTPAQTQLASLQAALSALGISSTLLPTLTLLTTQINDLQQVVNQQGGQHFYSEAFSASAGFGINNDMIVDLAKYLNNFALYCIQQALALQATYPLATDILANMPPFVNS